MWNGTHFAKSTLQQIGLRVQLGHGGGVCPHPKAAHNDFTVFDISGYHKISLDYCGCSRAPPKVTQLLRASLFPGTLKRPQTAFTFGMLDTFHRLSLQGKTSAYDFFKTIVQSTDPLQIDSIPVRLHSCLPKTYLIGVGLMFRLGATTFIASFGSGVCFYR